MKLEYTVSKEDDNILLKKILKEKLYISSILLNKLKLCQGIFVNDIPTFVNYKVKAGDNILVIIPKETKRFSDKFTLVDLPLDIIYEDEYILVVNKPDNMPIHPSSDNYTNTLSNIVAKYLEDKGTYGIHIISRLDKNTTGLCIFAKNEYIQELFVRKKKEINFQKEYICVVHGIIKKEHEIIQKNIARKKDTIILREVNDNGDYAKTEYFVLNRNYEKNYSVLKVILHTGRTHQIRVHMAYISHPILGDELYGNEAKITNICKYSNRQLLHAYNLKFNHPFTNEPLNLIAPIPSDMSKYIVK